MKPTKKIFFYIVFGLAALVVFLYLRFPSDLVRHALEVQLKKADPKASFEIDHISPTIPPGLKLEPLSIHYAEQPIIRLDFLKVRPNLFNIFSSSDRYIYRGDIGSGDLRGQAVTEVENNRAQSKITLTLNRVPLNYLEILNQWKGYQADGELDANIAFDTARGGGTANIDMEVSPARIAFDPPLMGISALDFSQLKGQLVATQRMLQIKNCDAVGNQVDGKITGSIVFRDPIEESRISLSLTVKPQQEFLSDHKNDMIGGLLTSAAAQKRGVVFRITGTINNPRYVIR
ncbi:MAG: type II secretion system protein GspN [Desulfobacteraceae bacterium]|jgi:type II secretion system protein N